MSGLIGVIANDFSRVSIIHSCLINLHDRTLRSGIDVHTQYLIGTDYVGGRNSIIQIALDEGHDWVWFMDDDHAFPPTALLSLLRWDAPIVAPVCLKRFPPYTPVVYTEKVEGEAARYRPLYLPEAPTEGLIEIEAAGTAGLLIRREVLEAMEPPWFEMTPLSEDLVFCERAKELGFSIHCDLSVRVSHITTAALTPTVVDGKWIMGVTVGQQTQISVPFEMME